jgi:hypothetical protein
LQLYHVGAISHTNFKRIFLQSVGMPLMLMDQTTEPPFRLNAQTKADIIEMSGMKAAAESVTTTRGSDDDSDISTK